ncbi:MULTISPECIES: YraN family protein [Flavobacteriaceae]|uniref:YraN family protein n=1 Tax=Flavobacteriaceae TaxID=49546 RepID=UPI0010AEABF9|nr:MULTISPECIES: YraN family protein [Flavobacteriaceae]NJB36439.1 endonuclease [Croceivirga sp. JEA036]TKD67036.1 endonuclease [Flavobacterium sp. ASW18X]
MGQHNEFGKLGEQLAVNFLQEKGYQILERNYRYLKAEIDIIAQVNNLLVIVEVKSRSSNYLQEIIETVNEKKKRLLVQAADYYVTSLDLDVEVQFDIVTILKNQNKYVLEHLENAFYHF